MNDADNYVSISEHVQIRKLRWKPDRLRWADRKNPGDTTGCTSPGLWSMTIGQFGQNITCDKEREYPFPQNWKVAGTYTCTVNWSPCNFGVSGATITYSNVAFYLEFQAVCQ